MSSIAEVKARVREWTGSDPVDFFGLLYDLGHAGLAEVREEAHRRVVKVSRLGYGPARQPAPRPTQSSAEFQLEIQVMAERVFREAGEEGIKLRDLLSRLLSEVPNMERAINGHDAQSFKDNFYNRIVQPWIREGRVRKVGTLDYTKYVWNG